MAAQKSSKTADYDHTMYFDIQAEMGHTKHLGGAQATRELLELCDIGPDKELLYVGCGAGASVVYIVKTYGCRIVAVDNHPKMVEVAQERATRLGVADRATFRVADAQDLPFEDNRFDILICESVNPFVPDLARAAREYVRVVKLGGYVGLNESVWVKEPTEALEAGMEELVGIEVRRSEVWEGMLTGAGLENLVVHIHELKVRAEASNQLDILSWREYFRILGRFFRMMFSDRRTRSLMRQTFSSTPAAFIDHIGYGLYVGRKPA